MFFQIFRVLNKLKNNNSPIRESYVSHRGTSEVLDQTGRISSGPVRLTKKAGKNGIIFCNFENSVAHSFWRSQELSLFHSVKSEFTRPILDFGCGDGAFSSCIFDDIDYGVDVDEKALSIAGMYHLYKKLLTFGSLIKEIPDKSIGTVFSCSVLEHTTNLQECIAQISRILKSGGRLYFTVPNPNLTAQMELLGGKNFAYAMNERMFHRNLLDESQWRSILGENGFKLEKFQSFQPAWFTKKYFSLSLLGKNGLGAIPGIRKLFLAFMTDRLMCDVDESITSMPTTGANYYVVASKI